MKGVAQSAWGGYRLETILPERDDLGYAELGALVEAHVVVNVDQLGRVLEERPGR